MWEHPLIEILLAEDDEVTFRHRELYELGPYMQRAWDRYRVSELGRSERARSEVSITDRDKLGGYGFWEDWKPRLRYCGWGGKTPTFTWKRIKDYDYCYPVEYCGERKRYVPGTWIYDEFWKERRKHWACSRGFDNRCGSKVKYRAYITPDPIDERDEGAEVGEIHSLESTAADLTPHNFVLRIFGKDSSGFGTTLQSNSDGDTYEVLVSNPNWGQKTFDVVLESPGYGEFQFTFPTHGEWAFRVRHRSSSSSCIVNPSPMERKNIATGKPVVYYVFVSPPPDTKEVEPEDVGDPIEPPSGEDEGQRTPAEDSEGRGLLLFAGIGMAALALGVMFS